MKIILFGTENCPWCVKAKDYLKEKGVQFEYIDVSQDQDAAQEMIKKSKQMSVPVLEINGTIIVGFDKEKIDEALKGGKK